MVLKLGVIASAVNRIQFHNWSDWISNEENPIATGEE
ncbi:3-mercaptopyruvate sulfurtransferase SseA [Paenibacillus harenae]|nr:3-mercaptopyruvate sulfurtransferase SseA [Paenibacillus harenae]